MNNYANRFTTVLDANVLFPFLKRDVLLSCAEQGMFRPRWTVKINEEWSSKAVLGGLITQAQAGHTLNCMRKAFPEAEITGYEHLIDALTLPDPDDRHVLAAAIRIKADMIVTDNVKDFPPDVLAEFEIETSTADVFLANTVDLYKADAVKAISTARKRCKNPPYNKSEYMRLMLARGLVETVAEIKPYFEDL